ncbi:hypothetical protein KY347_03395 [Candidatus Woesearchaeota archaeon]|nr:hypothetical protein [Candidatus Woesearchaeota archaeon]
MRFNRWVKYPKEKCELALDLVNKGFLIKDISKKVGVPTTTIRNWKHGYTKLFGIYKRLDSKNKEKAQILANRGCSIKDISKELDVGYNSIRLFLKKTMIGCDYQQIKLMNRKMPEESKELTKELAYIAGVMLGDGYFAEYSFSLDTIDKEFRDYFSHVVKKWSNKKPSLREFVNNTSYFYGCLVCSKDACDYLGHLIDDKEKFLKEILSCNNEDIKSSFIKGFSDSEGSILEDHRFIRIYNTNKGLLESINQLLVSLGFDNNKMHIRLSTDKTYELGIKSHKNIELFYKKIGFTIKRKQKRLKNFIDNKRAVGGTSKS